jgi:hypothetical protein
MIPSALMSGCAHLGAVTAEVAAEKRNGLVGRADECARVAPDGTLIPNRGLESEAAPVLPFAAARGGTNQT